MVSIITPVKNAATWLPHCIESVLEQDLTNWEWILVDDHSVDSGPEIIAEAAAKDPRITLITGRELGILPALSQALSAATGEYLTRMDADDLMPQGRLSRMVKILQNSPARTVVTGRSQYFPADRLSGGYLKYQEWLNQNLETENPWAGIYRECIIASPNWLVRTNELRECGGFGGLQYPEDYDLCFRWYQEGFKIINIPDITLLWREHPLRTSRTSDHYSQSAFFELKIQRFLQLDYDPQKQLCIWGSGKKARITQSLLRKYQTGFTRMSLKKPDRKAPDNSLWYQHIEELEGIQILIAVYPDPEDRERMEDYLRAQGYHKGVDYWYL